MRFNLKRPCARCPFRVDIPGYLTEAFARELGTNLLDDDSAWFGCHKTTELVEDLETGDEDLSCVESTEQCAGSLLFVLNIRGKPNIATRLASFLGTCDLDALDLTAPVAKSLAQFIEHHAAAHSRRESNHDKVQE